LEFEITLHAPARRASLERLFVLYFAGFESFLCERTDKPGRKHQMLYKPKFCCNCGEKIERADWNLLTSRRFCDACAAENKRYDRLPLATVVGGVLAVMFGLGTLFGEGREQQRPVQTLSTSSTHSRSEASATKPADKAQTGADVIPDSNTVPPRSPATIHPTSANSEVPNKVHFCGALTKKGTPCSRKVKVAGTRCFQHDKQLEPVPRS